MKINILLGLLVITGLPFLSSCDKEEPKPAGLTFELTDSEVTESDGTIKSFHPLVWESYTGSAGATGREIQVRLVLDKPLAQTSVITYSVSGTAKKNSASVVGDFEIDGDKITIEKGATEAFITFTLFEDLSFEFKDQDFFETIIFKLESVVSGPIAISETNNTHTLKVNEDDTLIILEWAATDADLDLFLWFDGEILTYSAAEGADPEAVFIPGGFPNGTYGFSYTYYDGTSDDVVFTSDMLNLGGTLNNNGDELSFTGNYTLAHINKYDADGVDEPGHDKYKGDPVIVQSMDKNGLNYVNITEIAERDSGSRIGRSRMNNKTILRNSDQLLNLHQLKKHLK